MSTTILLKKENISIVIDTSNAGNDLFILEGQLVIKNAQAIKTGLMAALDASQNLTIVCRNILKLDLAVLQLFLASQKTASLFKKILLFDMEPTDYMRSVIFNSGIKNLPVNFKMN